MKKILIIIFTVFCSINCYASNFRLHSGLPDFEGQHFDIDLKFNCQEGEVACDNVSYDSINKKTGAKLHLKGRVLLSPDSNNFQGYEFDNGKYSYILTPDYTQSKDSLQLWTLNVFYEEKSIATDQGIMH